MDSDGEALQPDRDAESARATAIGLEDASVERFEATMKVLLLSCYDGDAARIAAAAEVCRARHEECGTVGWDEGAALLDQALHRLHLAGADRGEEQRAAYVDRLRQEMYPEPEPFTWPARSAPERGWRRRAWIHVLVQMCRRDQRWPGGDRVLLLCRGRATVGKMHYRVCDQCRRGYVRELNIYDPYRGLGLGKRAARAARRGYEGYRWTTTPQYPTAGTFWAALGYEVDAEDGCPHMRTP